MLPAVSSDRDEATVTPSEAPALPIENNLVAAVRALEAAKQQCEQALFQLQWMPRNHAEVFGALGTLQGNVANAINAYDGYREILNCRGQA